ncbi:MAG: DUF5655 domain-containing protein [Microgenomates group bacterium]
MEELLFEGKDPKVKAIYREIKRAISTLGVVKFETKKTSIHVVARVAFLGIHPKTKWLDLNIVTVESITSPRVNKTERVSANRFHNTIRLTEVSQVDSELINWIKKSYAQLC